MKPFAARCFVNISPQVMGLKSLRPGHGHREVDKGSLVMSAPGIVLRPADPKIGRTTIISQNRLSESSLRIEKGKIELRPWGSGPLWGVGTDGTSSGFQTVLRPYNLS